MKLPLAMMLALIFLMILINGSCSIRLVWPVYNHPICSYLDNRFPATLLMIGYHQHDGHLWIITDDSYLHSLLPLKTMNNMIVWDYMNMDSVKISENGQSVWMKNIDQIIMMSAKSYDYFILIRNNHFYNAIACDLNKYGHLSIVNNMDIIDKQFFIEQPLITMNIDNDRLLLIKKKINNIYGLLLFENSRNSSLKKLFLIQNDTIDCQIYDKNLDGSFCSMLSKEIIMNFFDGYRWNFVDELGQLYRIEKHYFIGEFLSNITNIRMISNDSRTIFDYFDCHEHDCNNLKPEKNDDQNIIIILCIFIVIQFAVFIVIIQCCFCNQILQKMMGKNQKKNKSRSTLNDITYGKTVKKSSISPIISSIFTPRLTSKSDSIELSSSSKLAVMSSEPEKKSPIKKMKRKRIIRSLQRFSSKQKISSKSSLDDKIRSKFSPKKILPLMTSQITCSDYYNQNSNENSLEAIQKKIKANSKVKKFKRLKANINYKSESNQKSNLFTPTTRTTSDY